MNTDPHTPRMGHLPTVPQAVMKEQDTFRAGLDAAIAEIQNWLKHGMDYDLLHALKRDRDAHKPDTFMDDVMNAIPASQKANYGSPPPSVTLRDELASCESARAEAVRECERLKEEVSVLRKAFGLEETDKVVLEQQVVYGCLLIDQGSTRKWIEPIDEEVVELETELAACRKELEQWKSNACEFGDQVTRLQSQLTEARKEKIEAWDAYDKAGEVIDTLRPQPSPWISVNERMPEDTKEPDGGTTCVFAHHKTRPECSSPFQMSNVVYLRNHPEEYTHWMPIPPLPAPVEDEAFEKWFQELVGSYLRALAGAADAIESMRDQLEYMP